VPTVFSQASGTDVARKPTIMFSSVYLRVAAVIPERLAFAHSLGCRLEIAGWIIGKALDCKYPRDRELHRMLQ
jgi:hypothetical protein